MFDISDEWDFDTRRISEEFALLQQSRCPIDLQRKDLANDSTASGLIGKGFCNGYVFWGAWISAKNWNFSDDGHKLYINVISM